MSPSPPVPGPRPALTPLWAPFLLLLPVAGMHHTVPGKAERRGENKTRARSRRGEEEDTERPGGSETHGKTQAEEAKRCSCSLGLQSPRISGALRRALLDGGHRPHQVQSALGSQLCRNARTNCRDPGHHPSTCRKQRAGI